MKALREQFAQLTFDQNDTIQGFVKPFEPMISTVSAVLDKLTEKAWKEKDHSVTLNRINTSACQMKA